MPLQQISNLHILAIGMGGFLGAISRFWIAREMLESLGSVFPYGTLTVNILGSFLLGFSNRLFMNHPELVSDIIRLGLTVGFLGAFTTFSAFSYESISLFENGDAWKALINILSTAGLCLGACWVGLQLGNYT